MSHHSDSSNQMLRQFCLQADGLLYKLYPPPPPPTHTHTHTFKSHEVIPVNTEVMIWICVSWIFRLRLCDYNDIRMFYLYLALKFIYFLAAVSVSAFGYQILIFRKYYFITGGHWGILLVCLWVFVLEPASSRVSVFGGVAFLVNSTVFLWPCRKNVPSLWVFFLPQRFWAWCFLALVGI